MGWHCHHPIRRLRGPWHMGHPTIKTTCNPTILTGYGPSAAAPAVLSSLCRSLFLCPCCADCSWCTFLCECFLLLAQLLGCSPCLTPHRCRGSVRKNGLTMAAHGSGLGESFGNPRFEFFGDENYTTWSTYCRAHLRSRESGTSLYRPGLSQKQAAVTRQWRGGAVETSWPCHRSSYV